MEGLARRGDNMKKRECTECGHEAKAKQRCAHCGAPELRGSALTGILREHGRAIRIGALAAGLLIVGAGIAYARDGVDSAADEATAALSTPERPDRFSGVTARTGREWVEQCDQAAQKSDSTIRVGSCVSFLQGARAVATRSSGKECTADLARQTRGDVWITTFQIARRYPGLPIKKVFAIAFDAIEPDSCRKHS
jgi:hypothetical protein